jgi:GNAT superfamily N-acetyltransferase
MTYGLFPESIGLDGASYPAERVDNSYARRAGFAEICAINGLPPQFENALIRASQVCDVPHTWRVKECRAENEVTNEILQDGKRALDEDRTARGSHIITYVGKNSGDYEFLAAGAIRDKLTTDYHNPEYPVVSRAIVAPAHRGKGLGSLIVEHRFKAVLRFFGARPKAIHFGTESEKILHAIKKVEQDEGLKYVHIGYETYTAFDGPHVIADYLCFMPWFQTELLAACDVLAEALDAHALLHEFKEKLNLFMTSGITQVTNKQLADLFQIISQTTGAISKQSAKTRQALHLINEVSLIKDQIGAADPVLGSYI